MTNNATGQSRLLQIASTSDPNSLAFSKIYTDGLGRATKVVYTPSDMNGVQTVSHWRPGSVNPDTVVSLLYGMVQKVVADGITTSYATSTTSSTYTITISKGATSPLPMRSATFSTTGYRNIIADKAWTTAGAGDVTQYEYYGPTDSYPGAAALRVKKMILPEGNYVGFEYDSRGNNVKRTWTSKLGNAPLVETAVYPAACSNVRTCNRPLSITDRMGRTTDYAYGTDAAGFVTSVTTTLPSPGGAAPRPQSRQVYAPLQAFYNGAPSGQNVYKLVETAACATAANQPVGSTGPLSCAGTADQFVQFVSYGALGVPNNLLPRVIEEGSGNSSGAGAVRKVTTAGYDGFANMVSLDGPLAGTGDTSYSRFDILGRKTGDISPDPDGAGPLAASARKISYNFDGTVQSVESGTDSTPSSASWSGFAAAESESYTYANAKRVKTVKSGGGAAYEVTQVSYDGFGRPECTATRMNPAAFASPPAACVLGTSGSFGPDRITKTAYDSSDRIVSVQLAYGTADQATEVTNSWTPNGKLATVRDGENNLTTYEYDAHDQLLKTRYPVATPGAGVSSATDYEQLTYDLSGNVTQRRLRDGQSIGYTFDNLDRPTFKDLPGAEPDVSYTYDLLGRLTQASQSGNVLTFGYDALSRRLTETGPLGTMTSQYDPAGNRTAILWPDGAVTSYGYDSAGEMSGIYEGAGTAVPMVVYNYDGFGRPASVNRRFGANSAFSYDPVGQLTSLSHDFAGSGQDLTVATMGYNPASQLTSQTRSNDLYAWNSHYNVNRDYSVDGLNRLTAAGTTPIGYDARGNLTSSGASLYAYSSENYLVSGPGVTLTYDPLGRLYQVSGASGITRFQYDGDKIAAEYNGSNTRLRRFAPGPGADEPALWYEGSGIGAARWYHADERGSVIGISDSAGSSVAINRYDEYGIPGTGNSGRFQYTGQAWIPELGLYYYKARFYSPTLGRFMQTDPIGYGDGPNWYDYAGGDPVNRSDPTGMCDPLNLNCIHDAGSAGRAPNLPTIETTPEIDTIVVTGLRARTEQTRLDGVPSNDELPIVVTGQRIRELRNGTDYSIEEQVCTSNGVTRDVTRTSMNRSTYVGASAGGHLHRANRESGPGIDDGQSVASIRVVQYIAWGRGRSFGAGKVEFRAGSGFTYQSLGGNQPPRSDIRSVLAGMNRGGGSGTKTGGTTCRSR